MVDLMQPGNQEVTKTLGAGCLRFPKLAVLGKAMASAWSHRILAMGLLLSLTLLGGVLKTSSHCGSSKASIPKACEV